MSDSPSTTANDIVLSASPWYLWRRVVAMTVLPIVFSAAFFYDWKIGYPKDKEQYQEYIKWQKDGKSTDEWIRYAEQRKWDAKPEEMTDEKIEGQFQWGTGVGLVGLGLLLYYGLSYPKKLKATQTAFSPPWHGDIRYDQVRKFDIRTWKHKGLAYAYYEQTPGGKQKKAVIDDFRFVGADAVKDLILAKFDGEIIEHAAEPAPCADTIPETVADTETTNV
jgi:hypothetical protein